jgi:hypothetical protein
VVRPTWRKVVAAAAIFAIVAFGMATYLFGLSEFHTAVIAQTSLPPAVTSSPRLQMIREAVEIAPEAWRALRPMGILLLVLFVVGLFIRPPKTEQTANQRLRKITGKNAKEVPPFPTRVLTSPLPHRQPGISFPPLKSSPPLEWRTSGPASPDIIPALDLMSKSPSKMTPFYLQLLSDRMESESDWNTLTSKWNALKLEWEKNMQPTFENIMDFAYKNSPPAWGIDQKAHLTFAFLTMQLPTTGGRWQFFKILEGSFFATNEGDPDNGQIIVMSSGKIEIVGVTRRPVPETPINPSPGIQPPVNHLPPDSDGQRTPLMMNMLLFAVMLQGSFHTFMTYISHADIVQGNGPRVTLVATAA